jgi:hypothetical protein
MIVLVESITLEGDADLGEDLPHAGAALVGFAVVHLGADGEGVVRERLPEFEHLAGAFTSVVIGRHG